MSNSDVIELEGVVDECLPGAKFRVQMMVQNPETDQWELPEGSPMLLCTISGRMRKNRVRIIPGDNVVLEVSPYDMTKGRIVYRNKV